MKKILSYASRLNNKSGFTYIEALASLSVAAVIMSLMPAIFTFFQNVNQEPAEFEADFFVLDITEVFQDSEEIEVASSKLAITFKNDKRDISYRKAGDRIIRSVDGSGFVTVMFGVDRFDIKESPKSIELAITSEDVSFNETLLFWK